MLHNDVNISFILKSLLDRDKKIFMANISDPVALEKVEFFDFVFLDYLHRVSFVCWFLLN